MFIRDIKYRPNSARPSSDVQLAECRCNNNEFSLITIAIFTGRDRWKREGVQIKRSNPRRRTVTVDLRCRAAAVDDAAACD